MSNTDSVWINLNASADDVIKNQVKATMLKRLRENVKIISLMPMTSDVYGCDPCEVYWVDGPTCWCCGEQGLLLATAHTKAELTKQAHRTT